MFYACLTAGCAAPFRSAAKAGKFGDSVLVFLDPVRNGAMPDHGQLIALPAVHPATNDDKIVQTRSGMVSSASRLEELENFLVLFRS